MSTSKTRTAWQSVGDLELLLDPGSLLELLESSGVPVEQVTCNYIRLKPDIGALLGLEMELRTPDGEREILAGYIRTHPPERAAQLMEKWHSGRTTSTAIGDGVRLLAGGKSLLFLFPNDANLRGLRYISEKQKLKRLLSRLEHVGGPGWRIRGRKSDLRIVRYKPERRLIMRGDLRLKNDNTDERRERHVFLRFFTDNRGRRIASLCRSLHALTAGSATGLRVPRPLGTMLGGRLFVEQAVNGEEILPEVRAGRADPQALVAAVSTLHTAEVADLPALSTEDVFRAAEQTAENLLQVNPDLRELVDQVLERLRAAIPAETAMATLHGDCHLGQFLTTPEGPVLVDFERAVRGHPLHDLGHLSAHLEVLASREPAAREELDGFREALVSGYARSNPGTAMTALPFFTGCALLEHALLAFRNQEPDWPRRCREILELTLSRAPVGSTPVQRHRFFADDSQTPWVVFYPRPEGDWPGVIGGGEDRKERTYGVYEVRNDRFRESPPERDAKLPGLADWLPRGTLVSYRVGRRATVRVDGPGRSTFVKLVPPRKVQGIAERFLMIGHAASEGGASFPETPTLLNTDPQSGVLVFERMDGVPLHTHLTGEAELDPAHLEQAATGLARFHRTPWQRSRRPAAATHHDLRVCAAFVRGHDPRLESDCAAALKVLEALPTGPFGPADRLVHGDLHDRNLFLTGGIGLLDMDALGIGDPVEDVGNLAGHFVLRALQSGRPAETGRAQAHAFLKAYSGGNAPPSPEGINAVVARTLFRLACIYRFRRRWHHLCSTLVEESLLWARGEALS